MLADLLPGERIDYIIPALMVVVPSGGGNMLVVVTATRICVFTTGFRWSTPQKVVATYPRRTRLGPLDLSVIPSFTLGGDIFEIDDEYLAVVNAVDVEATGDAGMPQDPLPDL